MTGDATGAGPVQLEIADGVATLTLDRHEARNAIGSRMAAAFATAVRAVADAGAAVAVLRANGTTFCAGADLGEAGTPGAVSGTDLVLQTLVDAPVFWIAQVQGGCVGAGVALALSCPVVIASSEAWLWLPELSKLGRLPVPVVRRIIPLIGVRSAIGLAVTQRRVDAAEAMGYGWLAQVVAPDQLDATVADVAGRLAAAERTATAAIGDYWRQLAGPSAGPVPIPLPSN